MGPTGRREAFLAVKLNLYGNVVMEEIPEEARPTPGPGGQGKEGSRGCFVIRMTGSSTQLETTG